MPRPSDTVARPHAGSALRGHPIQVVMRRTGLSADVIRAWEKRYGVVAPHRSSSGRRLYSDADVERLRLLARATLTGRTIGQVAALPNAALAELARDELARDEPTAPMAGGSRDGRAPAVASRPAGVAALPPASAAGLLGTCLDAVERFDATSLEQALQRGVIALSAESFLDALVVPLWERIAAEDESEPFRSPHRFLTLAVLRRVLGRVTDAAVAPAAAPRLLATSLPGYPNASQELGMLLTAAAAAAMGWGVTVAGAALPADDIAALAGPLGVHAVVVSLGTTPGDRALPRELRRLRALLPAGVAILLEGAGATAHHGAARQIGATVVRDLPTLRARLRDMVASPEP